MKHALACLITLCAACASTTNVPVAQPVDTATKTASFARLFPLPTEALTIPSGGESGKQSKVMTFEQLTREMERITPVRFMFDPETRMILSRYPTGNLQTIVVPPERVWSVFEALLVESDFCLGFVSAEDPIVFSLSTTMPRAGRGHDSPRARATFVPVEELSAWNAHPAFPITTTVTLDHLDVRDLSNSMRQMFTDPQSQQIIPLGNTNSLMITGFAPPVANLVRTLQVVNEEARARYEREDKLSEEQRQKAASRTGVTRPQ